jgi:hypothetical protein
LSKAVKLWPPPGEKGELWLSAGGRSPGEFLGQRHRFLYKRLVFTDLAIFLLAAECLDLLFDLRVTICGQ